MEFVPYSEAEKIACRTKSGRYETKAQAKKALKQLRRQPGRRHLKIYECWHCGLFHIGQPPGHQTYRRAGRPTLSPNSPANGGPS